jgi:dCMP deaminase
VTCEEVHVVTDFNIAYADIWSKMAAVYRTARHSTDQSTKNGAILIQEGWNVIHGWNHHVEGYGGEPGHHERPLKYDLTEHAESDVIHKAAREGIKTEGLTMIANWVACPTCARAIVGAGIKHVICHQQCMDRIPERWKDQIERGLDILKRGGVELTIWSRKIGGGIENLNNGEIWYP